MSTGEPRSTRRIWWPLAWAVVLPGVALLGGVVIVLAGAAASWHPLWPIEPMTLSEAAALRDQATIARSIGGGVDPNEPFAVRAGVLADEPARLLPLEAAVEAQRAEIVALLFELGATLTEPDRTRVLCLAQRLGDRGVVAELQRGAGDVVVAAACAEIESLR